MTPKMNQGADTVGVSYFIQAVLQIAPDKNIAGKKRFNHTHHATPGRPLKLEARIEYFQPQPAAKTAGCYMLVLGVRSRAIPCSNSGFRFCQSAIHWIL